MKILRIQCVNTRILVLLFQDWCNKDLSTIVERCLKGRCTLDCVLGKLRSVSALERNGSWWLG